MPSKNGKITLGTIKNARVFYDKLAELSKLEPVGNEERLVFRGKLQSVFASMGVSQAFYSGIRRVLIDYDCVLYVERGGRGVETVLVLQHPPDVEQIAQKISALALTSAPDPAILEVQRAFESRLQTLEAWRISQGGMNPEILRNFEERLSNLEAQLSNTVGGQKFGPQT